MGTGQYKRCAKNKCRKGVYDDSDYCTAHLADRGRQMMENHPGITDLVRNIVAAELYKRGL